jgi:hypothetical protein
MKGCTLKCLGMLMAALTLPGVVLGDWAPVGLSGGGGNDALTGGAGPDFFSGGPGNDAYADFNAGQGDTSDGT